MKTLGINISHNASICQVTDGKIDFYYEEDRFNKKKYYAPYSKDCYYKSIEKKVKQKPDNIIVAGYDRSFLGSTKTLTNEDLICCDLLSKQLNQPINFFKSHHHLYHAFCGFYFSNFDEAIIVVMDGGGAQELHCYQEVESVYLMNKSECKRKYLHASCVRFNEEYDIVESPDKKFKLNDSDILLSSKKSMGYLFSDMFVEMGFKNGGADAGKLIGLSSYPDQTKPRELQEHSKNYTIKSKTSVVYSTIPQSDSDIYVITQTGDRLDLLAYRFYGDVSLWWYIARANNFTTMNIPAGISFRVPATTEYAKGR